MLHQSGSAAVTDALSLMVADLSGTAALEKCMRQLRETCREQPVTYVVHTAGVAKVRWRRTREPRVRVHALRLARPTVSLRAIHPLIQFEPIFSTAVTEFDRQYHVNVAPNIYLTQVVIDEFVNSGTRAQTGCGASVVHITSQSSTLPIEDHIVYRCWLADDITLHHLGIRLTDPPPVPSLHNERNGRVQPPTALPRPPLTTSRASRPSSGASTACGSTACGPLSC